MQKLGLVACLTIAVVMGSTALLPLPAYAVCPVPWYTTDDNDLIQIKGTVYDNAGNATKVQCTFAQPFGAYIAWTGGASTPPSRSFQGAAYNCPGLDAGLGNEIGPIGADVQIVKNGVPTNACAFVGNRDPGSGFPFGFYMSSVLKFDPVTGFKSEKGTLIYNLTTGSFIGKFSVIRR